MGDKKRNTTPLTGDPVVDFKQKASARTNAVLDALHRLGACGGPAYESTATQRAEILAEIRAALAVCESELTNGRAATGKARFALK